MRVIISGSRRPIIHSPGPRTVPTPIVYQPFPIRELFDDFIPVNAGKKAGTPSLGTAPRLLYQPFPIRELFDDFVPAIVSKKPGTAATGTPPRPVYQPVPIRELFVDDVPAIASHRPATNVPGATGLRFTLQPFPIREQFDDFIPAIVSHKPGTHFPPVMATMFVQPVPILEQFADFTPSIVSHKPGVNAPASVAPRIIMQPFPVREQFTDDVPSIASSQPGMHVPPLPATLIVQPVPLDDRYLDNQIVSIGMGFFPMRIVPIPCVFSSHIPEDASVDLPTNLSRSWSIAGTPSPRVLIFSNALEQFADTQPQICTSIPRTVPLPGMTVNVIPPSTEDRPLPIFVRTIPRTVPNPAVIVAQVSQDLGQDIFAKIPGTFGRNPPTNVRPIFQPSPILEQFADNPQTVRAGNLGVNVPAFVKPPIIVQPVPIVEQFTDNAQVNASGRVGNNVPLNTPIIYAYSQDAIWCDLPTLQMFGVREVIHYTPVLSKTCVVQRLISQSGVLLRLDSKSGLNI